MTQRIPLQGKRGAGRFALVDDSDFALVTPHRWHIHVSNAGQEYVRGWVNGRHVRMHCLIMGRRGIDHVNGDRLDNTRTNLRVATQSQNAANSGPRRGKQYKGTYWQQGCPWRAEIRVGGVRRHLGSFSDEESAARAYDTAALAAWGPFARLNFPVA